VDQDDDRAFARHAIGVTVAVEAQAAESGILGCAQARPFDEVFFATVTRSYSRVPQDVMRRRILPGTHKTPGKPGVLMKADEGIRTLDLRHGKAGKGRRGPQVRAVRWPRMAFVCC
jgi:hypothetical protein